VLPFQNITAGPQQEYFGGGIAEQLITGWSQTAGIYCRRPHLPLRLQGQVHDRPANRRAVEGALSGRGQRSARSDQVRINVQLIDGRTGNHIWAERYDRKLNHLFELQEQLTMAVMAATNVQFSRGETASLKFFSRAIEVLERLKAAR
jgi:adenylate cyclase